MTDSDMKTQLHYSSYTDLTTANTTIITTLTLKTFTTEVSYGKAVILINMVGILKYEYKHWPACFIIIQ